MLAKTIKKIEKLDCGFAAAELNLCHTLIYNRDGYLIAAAHNNLKLVKHNATPIEIKDLKKLLPRYAFTRSVEFMPYIELYERDNNE